MADLNDIVAKYGGARKVGDRLIFQRNGLADNDFIDLRQLGEVQLKANEVVVKLKGAERLVGKVDRDLDRSVRKATRLAASTKASRADRRRQLRAAGFGVSSDSIAAGPVRLGKRGITANRTFLAGGGGVAMTAALGLHLAGAGLVGQAELRREIAQRRAEGATRDELVRSAIGGIGKTAVKGAADLFGVTSFVTGVGVAFKGMSEEDARAFQERMWDRIFDTRESIERRRTLRNAAIAEAGERAAATVDETWERIGQYRPQGFKLKGKRESQAYTADKNKANRELLRIRRSAERSGARIRADMALPEVP